MKRKDVGGEESIKQCNAESSTVFLLIKLSNH